MKNCVVVVFVLLFSLLAPHGHAQMGQGAAPRFYADFKPVVGAWAEYRTTQQDGMATKMKMAIVGKEGNHYWYETVIDTPQDGPMITKMLVSGSPDVTDHVKRMIFKQGQEPAMEMPTQMMQMPAAVGKEKAKGKFSDKGMESVKVPAGTFKARHLQFQDGPAVVDIWVQQEIAPYGIVKSISKESEMVLLGYGKGAKTRITEKPQTFEMPLMPQMPSMR